MKKVLFLGVILSLATLAASAQQDSGERIRRHRVAEGYRSGELTRPEMRQLRKNETHYKMEKNQALRDGKISRREHRHLKHMKRHDRRQLYFYKHNRRHRLI
ncbi:MAG TPA: hypothetical protein VFS36_14740 [Chitinophagaceae bacterium]|nr:hypothetical protein [Chitinophagaceae bacterium]